MRRGPTFPVAPTSAIFIELSFCCWVSIRINSLKALGSLICWLSHSSRCIQCIEAKSRFAPMCSAQPSCSENQYFHVISLSSVQTACAYEIRNHVPSLGTPLILLHKKRRR